MRRMLPHDLLHLNPTHSRLPESNHQRPRHVNRVHQVGFTSNDLVWYGLHMAEGGRRKRCVVESESDEGVVIFLLSIVAPLRYGLWDGAVVHTERREASVTHQGYRHEGR